MMQPTTAQALGQARLADLHHQAERDALARAARQARRARSQPGDRAPGSWPPSPAGLAAPGPRLRARDGSRQPPWPRRNDPPRSPGPAGRDRRAARGAVRLLAAAIGRPDRRHGRTSNHGHRAAVRHRWLRQPDGPRVRRPPRRGRRAHALDLPAHSRDARLAADASPRWPREQQSRKQDRRQERPPRHSGRTRGAARAPPRGTAARGRGMNQTCDRADRPSGPPTE